MSNKKERKARWKWLKQVYLEIEENRKRISRLEQLINHMYNGNLFGKPPEPNEPVMLTTPFFKVENENEETE